MNERARVIANRALSIAELTESKIGRLDIQSVNSNRTGNGDIHYIGYVWLVKDNEAPREFALYEDGTFQEGGENDD